MSGAVNPIVAHDPATGNALRLVWCPDARRREARKSRLLQAMLGEVFPRPEETMSGPDGVPFTDGPETCEQCGGTDLSVEFHDETRRHLHPECLGAFLADAMPEDSEDLPEPWQDPNTKRAYDA